MEIRAFLRAVGASAAATLAAPAQSESKKPGAGGTGCVDGPALLTITGDISRTNRNGLDPALDQLMARQKVSFK